MFFRGEIPFVRLIIPLISGIIAGVIWPAEIFLVLATWGFASAIALFILFISCYKRHSLYRLKWVVGILIHILVLFAGYILSFRSAQKYNEDYFAGSRSDVLIIRVDNEPQFAGKVLRFESKVEQGITSKRINRLSGRLLIALNTDSLNPLSLKYGSRLLIPARYSEVEPAYNPGEFDYKGYLGNKQIYHQTFLNQQEVKVLNWHSDNDLISFAITLRKRLVDKFYFYLDDKDAAALASTLILGYRANLSKDIISAYSKTGTLHILSVSGMHVGIIFIVLNYLLRPLQRFRNIGFLNAVLIVSLIWFYALITGFSPSVCRAATMLSFVVLGKAFNKNLNTYNLLAISAFFLLLYKPYYLLDIGFQLSYLAVFGLVYLQPKIYGLVYLKNKLLDSIWSYSALSLAAQLATFPVSVYYFHQFPVYFLISNLIVVLPVAIIMYAGITFLLIPWDAVLVRLGDLLNGLISYTNNILFYIEDLPFSSMNGIWISRVEYLILYLVIGLIIWACTTREKPPVYLSFAFICLFCFLLTIKNISKRSNSELIFYSLRKNSAIAYIHHGKAYLISDLLNDSKTLSYSIMPALESRGVSTVRNIDWMTSFVNKEVNVKPGYLQLGGIKVLNWNRQLNLQESPRKKVNADIILITGNPFVSVKRIRDHVNFSTLLIDATNSNYRIKEWQAEARALKIPVYVLKNQPAYILNQKL